MKNRKIIITNDPIDGTIEAREQYAREEGREEGRLLVIVGALKNGKTPEQVSEFNGVPLEEVKKVQEEMLEEV